MSVTVSVRGQLVIPSKIRSKYKIEPHSMVEFIDTGQEIVLVPIPGNPIKHSRGILKGVTVNDVVRNRRAERKKEKKEGNKI